MTSNKLIGLQLTAYSFWRPINLSSSWTGRGITNPRVSGKKPPPLTLGSAPVMLLVSPNIKEENKEVSGPCKSQHMRANSSDTISSNHFVRKMVWQLILPMKSHLWLTSARRSSQIRKSTVTTRMTVYGMEFPFILVPPPTFPPGLAFWINKCCQ